MGRFDYDLLIIGGGSAGASAAMTARALGVERVAIVENGFVGGTCTNVGCVPSKSFLHAADLARHVAQARTYKLASSDPSDLGDSQDAFAEVRLSKNELVASMRAHGTQALSEAGVQVLKATASLASPQSLLVGGEELTAGHILLASGAAPAIPPIEGLSDTPYLTSTSALAAEKLPRSVVIIGGAYIGLEFASFYQALGVKTTVVEAFDRLAPNEDEMISAALLEAFVAQGIEVAVDTKVKSVRGDDNGIHVFAQRNGKPVTFGGESLLVAVGRKADFASLSLDKAGVEYGSKGIVVDDYLQSTAASVYAAGDVLPPPSLQLEHVAVYEGQLAVNNMFAAKRRTDYSVVPRVMFSFPEVASVGETAAQAKQRVAAVSAALPYTSIAMARIADETQGLIRLVAEEGSGRLLGAHIIGTDAGNLIHLATTVMRAGTPVGEVAETISAYPTLAQGFYLACGMVSGKSTRPGR